MRKDIQVAGADLRPFPEPDAVFVADQPWLARHLIPLISIRVSAAEDAQDEWVHLVCPLEPLEEGYPGGLTLPFHTGQVGENCLAFQLDACGRYRFLGDRRYFALENFDGDGNVVASADGSMPLYWQGQPMSPETARSAYREGSAHYAAQHAAFARARERYRRDGQLTWPDWADPALSRRRGGVLEVTNLLDQLGGPVEETHWMGATIDAYQFDNAVWNDLVVRSKEGRPFKFVASVAAWRWMDRGADRVLLFYEPVSRTALVTCDWT